MTVKLPTYNINKALIIFIVVNILISYNSLTYAKDLGIYGSTAVIKEDDLLEYIKTKLENIGEVNLKRHQEKIKDKIISRIKKPKPVKNITKADKTTSRIYDPSIVVEEDIANLNGQIIHKAGTRINPLDYMEFTEEWIIIDGEDEIQVRYAKSKLKQNNKPTKIILINGSPGLQEDESFFYFDQFGEITSKLGITRVPSIIKQAINQKLIEIEEIDVFKEVY